MSRAQQSTADETGYDCPGCGENVEGFATICGDRVHVQDCDCVVPAVDAPFYRDPDRESRFGPPHAPDVGDGRLEPGVGGGR